MPFQPTPLNVTTLLVVALAFAAMFLLARGRHDSNLPLLFYSAVLMMVSSSDRTVSSTLLIAGLATALMLRFEFMSKGFTKFMTYLTMGAMSLIVLSFLDQVFGSGTLFS